MHLSQKDESELLALVGDSLTAKEYKDLLCFLLKVKPFFSSEIRIEIQNTAKLVGDEISGSAFEDWLNKHVAGKII